MNCYDILQINYNASSNDIKKAYRQLAKKYHPDRNQHLSIQQRNEYEAYFKKINQAYHQLINPEFIQIPTTQPENNQKFCTVVSQRGGSLDYSPIDQIFMQNVLPLLFNFEDILYENECFFYKLFNDISQSQSKLPDLKYKTKKYNVETLDNNLIISVKYSIKAFINRSKKTINLTILGKKIGLDIQLNKKQLSKEILKNKKKSVDKFIINQHPLDVIDTIIINTYVAKIKKLSDVD